MLPLGPDTGHANGSVSPPTVLRGRRAAGYRHQAEGSGRRSRGVDRPIANLSESYSPMNSRVFVLLCPVSSLRSGVGLPVGRNASSQTISRSTSQTRSRSLPSLNSRGSVRTISAERSSRRSACRRIDSTRTVASNEPSLCWRTLGPRSHLSEWKSGSAKRAHSRRHSERPRA
jgi:hypothetical protein